MDISSPKEQIAERQKAIEANDELIRKATQANHWHRKYIRLLEKQIEEEKETPASEVISDISSNGLK